jgi:PKD repeat protein
MKPGKYSFTFSSVDSVGTEETTKGTLDVAGSPTPPPPNSLPVARITASVVTGTAPQILAFSGIESSDPDGSINNYAWSIGDGSTYAGVECTHTFSTAGTYVVRLIVTDNQGATAEASVVVTILPGATPPGPAVVAYTTLNAAGDIPSTYGWTIADPGAVSGPGSALELSTPFVPSVTGKLHSVELPISRDFYTATSATPRPFSISTDNGGRPGAKIASWDAFIPKKPSGMNTLVVSENPPLLVSGTKYWFTGHINPVGTAADSWSSNGLGLNGPLCYRRSPTIEWAEFTAQVPAYRVFVS